jgi:hydrogenase maturation protein HypF
MPPLTPQTIRKQIRVTGVVQGVGFRPFVYAAALRCRICGFVANHSSGVTIEADGSLDDLNKFLHALRHDPPALARIDELEAFEIPALGDTAFIIHQSHAIAGENTPVPPDIATCAECLSELFDPANRRYRYPFINCTNCGPRFTIIHGLPYDRPLTTMAGFTMCPDCEAEYRNPLDRRFHAQPIACPKCGPQLQLVPGNLTGNKALLEAQRLLRADAIVAIKGIGGFHLACDATSNAAVQELRRRKGRVDKPFAVMMRDMTILRRYAEAGVEEECILAGRERPIVLLQRKLDAHPPLADSIAPGQAQLGLFLPYSPLHALLVDETPLVMTSGNRSDEPIARDNEEALERLAGLADAFLLHNRPIHAVCDDSVVRVAETRELPIRRSRGYAPLPVQLPVSAPAVFAAGAELKATFCLARGSRAYLSQHIGDMENLETQLAYERALAQMRQLFHIDPQAVACDLHPGYLSTQWAAQFAAENNLRLIKIQHHHAHAAALMAEHALPPDAQMIAVVFDGTGLGTDGGIWGGEILSASYQNFERLGHLKYVPLPGGDSAIRNPYRMALAHLYAARIPWDDLPCTQPLSAAERSTLSTQLIRGLNRADTSSMGRLFDAAASLLGIRHEVTYEAQGAMELEARASQSDDPGTYGFGIEEAGPLLLEPAPVWRAMIADLRASIAIPHIAVRFHRGVAELIAAVCTRIRARTRLSTVGLTGGVFQNALLLKMTSSALAKEGFEVLAHRVVPPNDGGLSLGQAAIAACRLRG